MKRKIVLLIVILSLAIIDIVGALYLRKVWYERHAPGTEAGQYRGS